MDEAIIDTRTLPPRVATLVRLIVRHADAFSAPAVSARIDCGGRVTMRVDTDPHYAVNVCVRAGE